jgi:hydroxymethylpyrimidine pyrophosphatase-like HAD family hydrolase
VRKTIDGTNKGVAVRELCEARGIDVVDTIAFGDNYNDLRMLEAAGFSVVMGNAPEDIRRDAGMVTNDNDHDGVAHALHKLILDRA